MPMWILAAACLRPGMSSSRPRGAPEPTKTASVVFTEQLLQAVDALATFELDAEIEDVIGFLIDHRRSGSRNFGICDRIMPPALGSEIETGVQR